MSSDVAPVHPLVSVLVPTWNGRRYIREAIDSALAQTMGDLEVVVIDDGSTDGTPDVVRAVADPRVRLIEQPNAGTAAARNTGLRHAHGEFVALLDHDDRWLPRRLELQLPLLRDPAVGLVHGGGRVFDADSGRTLSLYAAAPEMDLHDLLGWCRVGCATTIFPRRVVEQVGSFDASLPGVDDWDLWIRIARAGYRVLGVAEPVVEIREHPDNQGKRVERIADLVERLLAKPEIRHPGCAACSQSLAAARRRLREDFYVKTSIRARQAAAAGRFLESLRLRCRAATRYPAMIPTLPARTVRRFLRPA